MIRVCPKRDAVCPHGMDCPFVIDKYNCKPEPPIAAIAISEIYLGVSMARARGVDCGSPTNIEIKSN
jgi:hypothetical protein